jgi:tRNA(fMet)-specific endonuclease VapC
VTAAYLLDTNVLSELARRQPDAMVEKNVQAHQLACAIAAPCLEELVFGITRLAPSPKREMLQRWLEGVSSRFTVLPFDARCALWLGRERARLAQLGKPAPRTDGEIAAIAATNGLVLVTRNVADFQYFAGLQVENWFSS